MHLLSIASSLTLDVAKPSQERLIAEPPSKGSGWWRSCTPAATCRQQQATSSTVSRVSCPASDPITFPQCSDTSCTDNTGSILLLPPPIQSCVTVPETMATLGIMPAAVQSTQAAHAQQQQPVVVYTAMWSTDDILYHTASNLSIQGRRYWDQLSLSQDALLTLPDFGYAQVMTQDEVVADALGFCDAEKVVPGSSTCFVLHREYVGAPWRLVGSSSGSFSACDELIPLTLCDLISASRCNSGEIFSCCSTEVDDSCYMDVALETLLTIENEDVQPSPSMCSSQTNQLELMQLDESCSSVCSNKATVLEGIDDKQGQGRIMAQLLTPWKWAWAWCKAATSTKASQSVVGASNGLCSLPAQLLCSIAPV